jgi:hypothetical protein
MQVNKLCITRMLQKVDTSMLPISAKKRRGRRPGAQYHKTPVNAMGTSLVASAPLTCETVSSIL